MHDSLAVHDGTGPGRKPAAINKTTMLNMYMLCCRVEYYIVDTFQDAWQRYRAYRSIMLE